MGPTFLFPFAKKKELPNFLIPPLRGYISPHFCRDIPFSAVPAAKTDGVVFGIHKATAPQRPLIAVHKVMPSPIDGLPEVKVDSRFFQVSVVVCCFFFSEEGNGGKTCVSKRGPVSFSGSGFFLEKKTNPT